MPGEGEENGEYSAVLLGVSSTMLETLTGFFTPPGTDMARIFAEVPALGGQVRELCGRTVLVCKIECTRGPKTLKFQHGGDPS